MSMSAPSHRVGVGQTLSLTSLVTDAAGTALPGRAVVLQERGATRWRRVAMTTTGSTGVATAVTPAIARSARFRWRVAPGVTSAPWLVRMVPTLVVAAQVGGSSTTIEPSSSGSAPGDRIVVLRRRDGRTALVRRARLDAAGQAQIVVNTPRSRATYVVRLLSTARHTAAQAHVVVRPPAPAAVTISTASARVTVGGTTTISGTVTSASGSPLPGRTVVLLKRGALRWYPVARTTTDPRGRAALTTPPIAATSRFRLRTGNGVHSLVRRVVELPVLNASAQRQAGTISISVTSSGARPGDRVVLWRRRDGTWVKLSGTQLDGNGAATFTVPARRLKTAYVVRLAATARHGAASAPVVVPGV
jgi:hypothetical protein